jgi:hypothetical protein
VYHAISSVADDGDWCATKPECLHQILSDIREFARDAHGRPPEEEEAAASDEEDEGEAAAPDEEEEDAQEESSTS